MDPPIDHTSPSPSASPSSKTTTATTPPQPSPDQQAPQTTTTNEDDIWASSPPHSSTTTHHPLPSAESIPSDLPAIRRRRAADGYRDGLAVSKARVMQGGFDVGFPIGMTIGMRIGAVLGVLEGVVAALKRGNGEMGVLRETEGLLERAREELGRNTLLDGVQEEVLMRDGGVEEGVQGVLRKWEGLVRSLEGGRAGSDEVRADSVNGASGGVGEGLTT